MRMRIQLIFLLSIGIFLSLPCYSEVPQLINYQGILTEIDDTPVDGIRLLAFKIYEVQEGGDSLWTEVHDSVHVVKGVFSVILGAENPIPVELFSGVERWLGIRVGGGTEIVPRMRITSVPWAMHAFVADTALVIKDVTSHSHNHLDAEPPGLTGILSIDETGITYITGGVAIGNTYAAPTLPETKEAEIPTSDGKNRRPFLNAAPEEEPADKEEEKPISQTLPPLNGVIIEGDVGIGTDSPQAKLDVGGVVRAEGLEVSLGGMDGYILTSDTSGVATWQPNTGHRVPNIQYADLMDGINAGFKIRAAIDSLPEGGIVDARGLTGEQYITNDILLGVEKDVTILLGQAVYTISHEQNFQPQTGAYAFRIIGQGAGTVIIPSNIPVVFKVDMTTYTMPKMINISDLFFDLGSSNSTAIYLKKSGHQAVIERIGVVNYGSESPFIIGDTPDEPGAVAAHGTILRDLYVMGSSNASAINVRSNHVTVNNVEIWGHHAGVEIGIHNVTMLKIINSTFLDRCDYGLLADDINTGSVTFSNCYTEYCIASVKLVGLSGADDRWYAKNIVIRDNYFTGLEGNCLQLGNIIGLVIEGNYFNKPTAGMPKSVEFISDVSDITISGNTVNTFHSPEVGEIEGYETVGLNYNDISATQTSASWAFSRNLTVSDVMRLIPRLSYPDSIIGNMFLDEGDGNKLKIWDGSQWRSCW